VLREAGGSGNVGGFSSTSGDRKSVGGERLRDEGLERVGDGDTGLGELVGSGFGASDGGGGVRTGDRPRYGEPELDDDDEDVNVTGDRRDGGVSAGHNDVLVAPRDFCCGDGCDRESEGRSWDEDS